MLSEPYAMDSTISEGATFQQVVLLQDIPYPFISDGTRPPPSVEGELFRGPKYIVPKLSNISSNVSASQTTDRSSFPLRPRLCRELVLSRSCPLFVDT